MDTYSLHLFSHAPVGITVLKGPDFIVEMANQRCLEIVGRDEQNFVGLPLLEALPEINGQDYIDALRNVVKTREPYQSDETMVTIKRNNRVQDVYVNFVYQPIIEPDGTVDKVLIVTNEITEIVISRNKIKEAERRTRLAVESAHIGTFEWDLEGEHFIYSERFTEIFGFPGLLNVSRKQFLNVIHPDDRELRTNAHKQAALTGVLDYECRVLWSNGETRWVKISGKTFTSDDAQPAKLYGTILDITEQKNTADTLEHNKDQLKVALDAAEMGYWDVDPKRLLVFYSERIADWFGVPCNSGTALHLIYNALHNDDRKKVVREVQKAWQANSGGTFDLEFKVINVTNQKERTLRAKGKTYFNTKDEPSRFSGTVQDVTEYTLAKKNLEESELRYRTLLSGLPVAVYTIDEKGFVKLYNNAAVALWGRQPQIGKDKWCGAKRLTSKDGLSFSGENHPAAVAIKEDKSLCTEAIVERPDGDKRFVLAYPQPIHNLDGTIAGAINVVVDITDRSKAEAALEESEARFRLLANFMPQLIWAGDPAGNINYYNQAVYDYSGLAFEQIQNDGWLQIVHPGDRAENTRKWIHSITTGEDFILEHRFRRHDGAYRWQLSRALPQRDANNNITMWIGTSTDIHDQKILSTELEKRVEERTRDLKQANYALNQSNRELEQFAFAASHDMQEPLRKIQTFITFLNNNENNNLSEKEKNFLVKINNASLRMKALINSLLNYSQLSNFDKTHFVPTDLNTIIGDVKSDLELIINEKQATIINEKLPVIEAIPLQMNQLFYNLISNSLKFSKTGVSPVVTIATVKSVTSHDDLTALNNVHSLLSIVVSDNGIGFNQKHAGKIFDLFQRLNDKYSYEGTGIGLALCKKVVQNHGGEINAESEEGVGTKFNISLPLKPVPGARHQIL